MKKEYLIQDKPIGTWDDVLLRVKSILQAHKLSETTKVTIEKNIVTVEGAKTFK